ncbi:MAG: response regulator, partial [Desulfuromonadales bacterium]
MTAIHQDQGGSLWIGTGGGGLNRFDRQTETFTRFTENDGLASNTVFTILSDDAGSLWMGTAGGLSRFDPQRGSFRNYTASDGLQGDQFNDGAAFKSRDGEMFFGGPNGITAFFPQQIRDDENPPLVALTNIRLNYLPVQVGPDSALKRALGFTDEIRLSQADRVLSFDFAPLSYRAPEKNRCRYMLEGFDQGWTEVDSESCSATYTNLDPGRYVFRVTGSNGDGVWNEKGVSIAVLVPTPWWRTWWFLGGLGLTLVAVSFGAHRWRMWNLERRANQLETQVAQRTQALEASERQYRDLVEKLSDVIYAADLKGNFTYISPAIEAFLGYSPAEIVGRHFSTLIEPEDLVQVVDRFQRFADGENVGPGEYRMRASSGEVRWTRATSEPILAGDQVVGLRGVFTDVTAQREMRGQREREAAAAERQRLARDLHDSVTQTLYSIAAIAEALPGVSERQPELGRQGLHDLARLAGGALAEMRALLLELRPDAIVEEPLDKLLRQLVEATRGQTEVPVSLTLTGECPLPPDVQLGLYRIAQEGLNNALKHAHASQIKLGLYCRSERVTLGIGDNGRGFDSAHFGSGCFGLSNRPPLLEDLRAHYQGGIMSETDPIRVIAVDDHEVVRGGIRYALLDFDDVELVGEARDGEDAVRLCLQARPDVVLMDLMMPGMDGVETTRAIREQCPEVRILVLSSFHDMDLVPRVMQAGAIGYLLKGVSNRQLVEAIRAAHAGQPVLAKEAMAALVEAAAPGPKLGDDLSEREREVLALLAQGLSNKEIAE